MPPCRRSRRHPHRRRCRSAFAVVACTSRAVPPSASADAPSTPIRPGPSCRLVPGRPTVPPSDVPVTGEVPPAVMDAVSRTSGRAPGSTRPARRSCKAEAVEWPDGSLGCPELGVMYIQVITPGYQVVPGARRQRRTTTASPTRVTSSGCARAQAGRRRLTGPIETATSRGVASARSFGSDIGATRGAPRSRPGRPTTWVASLPTGAPPWKVESGYRKALFTSRRPVSARVGGRAV